MSATATGAAPDFAEGAAEYSATGGDWDEIVEAVRANGVPVEYVVFDDEGHGFTKKKNRIQGYEAILRFLDQHLKGNAAAGSVSGA